MINWKEFQGLHVVSKLDEILASWFGVELMFSDTFGEVKGTHAQADFDARNNFVRLLFSLDYGRDIFQSDIEKAINSKSKRNKVDFFESTFPYVSGCICAVEIEEEAEGYAVSFPIISDSATVKELETIISKFVELGANEEDAKKVVNDLHRMKKEESEYLGGLLELVGEEISTYHREISRREDRIKELNSELGDRYRYHSMIGKSKKMKQIYSLLDKISSSESSVFVQGENGTGKELVAKAIHFFSPRKERTFLAVNCSAFNDNLLDSELFGHVKGAFTGAVKDKKGLFEQADGGTLFLDEIGDTSLSMQVKLLRVLQEGTFLPVGATSPRRANVRIIAATNKDLKSMMAKGEFREDLFYRINVINVNLPPLRERSEDISLLIDYFLDKRCAEVGMPVKQIAKKCMEKMLDYPWPGNVRELENEVERLVVLAGDSRMISHDLLSPRIQDHGKVAGGAFGGIDMTKGLKSAIEELEMIMIEQSLKKNKFNKSKVARELGVSRASLIMKVEKYGLDKRAAKKAA